MKLLLLVAALGCTTAVLADETSGEPLQAVWKPQEIDFYYQSFTTFYSCDALENRVERLLKAVGVRDDVKVRVTGCESTNGPTRMPHVKVKLTAPVLATPEAIAEIRKGQTQRELTARVQGKRPEELTAQFPAQWRKVNLSDGQLDIDPGECELIDELNDKVFTKLAVKVVRDEISCTPNQRSIGQPRLEIEALTALPKPDEASKQ